MKYVIAELDRIAKYLEDFEEPWALTLAYRIDNVTQQIEDEYKKEAAGTQKISSNVLEQYKEDMEFLSSRENTLKDMISKQNTKNASEVYKALKIHFGKLNRKESIRFIKNVLKNTNK